MLKRFFIQTRSVLNEQKSKTQIVIFKSEIHRPKSAFIQEAYSGPVLDQTRDNLKPIVLCRRMQSAVSHLIRSVYIGPQSNHELNHLRAVIKNGGCKPACRICARFEENFYFIPRFQIDSILQPGNASLVWNVDRELIVWSERGKVGREMPFAGKHIEFASDQVFGKEILFVSKP